MGRGYRGSDVLLDLELSYEYMGHRTEEWNDIANLMEINLRHATTDLSYLKTDFDKIKENMETLAREFLAQNGNIRTGALYDSVKAKVKGNSITLSAPARDPRNGHPYAGHIEFGFTDRGGQAHGPWPFLRPAVHLAAQESTGMLGDSFAQSLLYGENFHAMSHPSAKGKAGRLAFGRTDKRIRANRARNLAQGTREHFNSGKQQPHSKNNTKQWNDANHGIWAKKSDSNFKTSREDDWKWGSL